MSGSHLVPETEEQLEAAKKLEEKVEELSHDEQLEKMSAHMEVLRQLFSGTATTLASRKKKSVVRVLEALLFGEFYQTELHGKEEKKLLDICMGIVQTKGQMYNLMVNKQLEEEENNESE